MTPAGKRCATALLCTLIGRVPSVRAEDPAVVVVRAYNTYGVPASQLKTAERTVRGLLESTGIAATWRGCRVTHDDQNPLADPCDDRVAVNEVIVRIVASVEGLPGFALGYSYVDAAHGRGTLATVYADRVTVLSETLQADTGVMLGRAVAHEIGHLLLGSQSHSALGLMRGMWTRDTMLENRVDDWRFTPQQAVDLRAAAGARRPPH